MTFTASGRSRVSAGNGVVTTFSTPPYQAGGLYVYLIEADSDPEAAAMGPADGTLLTEGVHYTVAGDSESGAAIVTTTAAYAAGQYVLRWRATSRDQVAEYNPGPFPAAPTQATLDRAAMALEEVADDGARLAARAIQVPPGQTAPALDLSAFVGMAIGVNADATAFAPLALGTTAIDVLTTLALASGLGLIGFAQSGAGMPLVNALTVLRDVAVQVHLFRKASDTNDTAAFTRAIATGWPVRAVAGMGTGAGGEYIVEDVRPIDGTIIIGDGIGRTIISPSGATAVGFSGFAGDYAVFFIESSSSSTFVSGVYFANMTLKGRNQIEGFSEHNHLVAFSGVNGAAFDRVEFREFQGDGALFSSGRTPGTERHNKAVTLRQCIFDGVDKNNRNGVSGLDVDGMLIDDCQFSNIAHSTMPGAIDFEPENNAFHIVRDVTIQNCRFRNIGGNVGAICFQFPAAVTAIPTSIRIVNNSFRDYQGAGAEIHIKMARVLTASDPDMSVHIAGNKGTGGLYAYALYSVKGLRAQGNAWENYTNTCLIGFTGADDFVRDASFTDRFVRCGTAAANGGVTIFDVANLSFEGSEFIDCGDGTPDAFAIDFNAGASERVSLERVKVTSPTGKTVIAVLKEAGHTFSASTNRQAGAQFNGLTNQFKSADPMGGVQLTAGVVTVTEPGATSTSLIFVNRIIDGGTLGCSFTIERGSGSFVVRSRKSDGTTETADTSWIAYRVEPGA